MRKRISTIIKRLKPRPGMDFNWDKLALVAGILIILLVVVMIGLRVNADNNISVKDLAVTNITDSAMTITWVSEDKYTGVIYYQESDNPWPRIFAQAGKDKAYDDRGRQKRHTHHVTLRDLKPETKYTFRIGGKINGKQAKITDVYTLPIRDDLYTPNSAYGTVEGVAEGDSFIYFVPNNLEGKTNSVLSSPISEDGRYNFDLNFYGDIKLEANDITAYIKSGKDTVSPYKYQSRNYRPLETIKLEKTKN